MRIALPQGVHFRAKGIVIGDFPDHAQVAGDHAEEGEASQQGKAEDKVNGRVGDMNAAETPM